MRIATAVPTKLLAGGLVILVVGACGGNTPSPRVDPGETVAVGYGRQAPRDVTGSVSSLSREDMERVTATRVEELIRDRVPGVHVSRTASGDYSFRIRGTRSFIGSNEPLFVIDGMAVPPQTTSTALAGLAPGDVVRIDVLKDAGSTAAYGSRGANGVIMITTRTYNGN
jgi:TonB-dependent starch-binding outer membrane protein SusC